MPFEKVDPQTDFPALERKMLELWDRIDVLAKLQAKNRGKLKWSFLDGPITANNPMGVHHAWGRTYKDVYNRYFAMTGHELRYQQGFDCQGLWVEVEVEKELGLKSKRDIENLVHGDVEASVDRFVQECKNRVDRFARVQTDQSIRLGFWMNWDRTDEDWAKTPDERKSYFTMSEENNYTIWSFLKKCHQRGLIYRGYDSMPWCGRCGVGISEMEMKEGYRLVEHKSAFIKLPLKSRPGENLLVWTTTPWTLTSNVGAAVNPELTYLKVKLKGEIYYVAKGAFKQNRMESAGEEEGEPGASATGGKKSRRDWLDGVPHLNSIEQIFKSKTKEGYEIVGEVRGSEMIGWEYVGPFDDLPAQQYPGGFPEEVARLMEKRHALLQEEYYRDPRTGAVLQPHLDAMLKPACESHRIISGGADVTETEGTGMVHTAPGCGAIDFQWGKDNGLPPVAPIDDSGVFHPGFGELTGKNAAHPATADAIFDMLKKKDVLFATERYVHRYPHCWRCKTELLYRLVDEWFINMGPRNSEEGFRGEIMKVVDRVTFLPESLNGRARERDWLWNMGDWMISKKRYWGLALPIWVDEKDPTQFEVIGSRQELQERAVAGWDTFEGHTPHRPWVDKVKIRNSRTGNLMSRIPDVGNPWLDAGIVAFSTMKYNTDRAYWRKWYPADFITESFPGQFRNWFYALLAMSTMMADGEPPFKTLLGYGLVMDQYGNPMSKSSGNSIEFIAAADEGGTIVGAKGGRESFAPIGADVMRWMYCRHNPAANLNFGPDPADKVRKQFHIKLWNCYSFFVNYARLDGFDATTPTVPVKSRPDIDRWILSDLQELITHAREAHEAYNVMAFCQEAERFVDDRLSNWYIRRNRPRFQSNVDELDDDGRRDKWAAHQTLYMVLVTLTKLFAPVIPFLSDAMFQNLRTAKDPESVHLCDFPIANAALVDKELSADMDALLSLVSLGGAARNVAKAKVRQPLAEFRVQTRDEAVERALERFPQQLREELNVKRVTRYDGPPLLTATAKLNKKTAAAKLGPKLKEAEAFLATLDAVDLAEQLRKGPSDVFGVLLDSTDIVIDYQASTGWAGVAEKGTHVALDARVTDELAREGLARDVIRQVQDRRKKSGLNMEDRIVLYLQTDSEILRSAIDAHCDHIAAETLTVRRSDSLVGDGVEVTIEGHKLKIGVQKAG
ncbi:MAG TPA: class I tRNA ligase family protein [Gemmataceae bacterium]|nr:class I tRNA ligase family protein [Gemmataceae bacterium]